MAPIGTGVRPQITEANLILLYKPPKISKYVSRVVDGMNPHLPRFIELLEDRKLAKLDIMLDDTEEEEEREAAHFENRFKIQKYVFLAKYFGLDMGYNYNVYIHGPYSSALADDYYELAKDRRIITMRYSEELPESFNANGFCEFVADKDLEWLEAASTLLSLNQSFRNRVSHVGRTANMKDHIRRDKIEAIVSELEERGLVKYDTNN